MKIRVVTLGCPKNIVDSEYLSARLVNERVQFVNDANNADVVIINTCAFILSAREEAINAILEAVQLKQEGRIQRIYVTGCLPQRYMEEVQKEIPEVDGFFREQDFQKIGRRIAQDLKLASNDSPLIRKLQTPSHYAYLKISEGCDNRCHYCTIPLIKGDFRSFDEAALLAETEELAASCVKELIVIAQDTTYYGRDRGEPDGLVQLLRKIAGIDGISWIRLLYAHPAHFSDELISLFSEIEKMVPYIDVPIQHISNKMLKLMGRHVTEKQVWTLIEKLRERVPEIAIRTTLMVGYPGEEESDFSRLKEFVEETKFERLGVFKYSPEDGTRAVRSKNQVAERVKEKRLDELMQLQNEIAYELNQQLVGRTIPVIIDEKDEDSAISFGRTQWDAPLIDNTVHVNADLAIGSVAPIRITEADAYDVWGELNK